MRILHFQPLFLITILPVLFITIISAHSQCLEDQRTLLLRLKNSLKFKPSVSTKLVSWNQNTECCHWRGVTCNNKTGHVIGLDLNSESISGGIDNSSSLFSLQFLERLNLAYNSFSFRPIPSGFNNLTTLTYLNLSNSDFAGQIPTALSRMARLVTLDLSTSHFFRETPLLRLENPNLTVLVQNLKELTELRLDGVNISSQGFHWCQAISSSLPNLKVLSMSNCHLSGTIDSSLVKLQFLSEIHLDGNYLAGPVPESFANFTNLIALSLRFCNLSGTFPEKIFKVPTLHTLDLSHNKLLTGSMPEFPLNGSLQTLVLSNTNFRGPLPNSVGNLGMLSKMELYRSNFSGPIPNSMSNLTQLVYLDLSFNMFTGPIPSFRLSKNLSHIDLSRNNLMGPIPSTHFEGLLNLEYIDLGFNSFSGDIPSPLLAIPSLQMIQLSSNNFTGTIPHSICNISYLQVVDLSNNSLSGLIPSCLIELSETLEVLNLAKNNFRGNISWTFSGNCGLKTLDLHRNLLEGKFPASLTNCRKLVVLNLGYNQINDNFPCFLNSSSNLRVLALRANLLHGDIRCGGTTKSWPTLQIIDIASNYFIGNLSPKCFLNPTTMLTIEDDTVSFNFDGQEWEFHRIWTFIVAIDISNNKFQGNIPDTIGELKLLRFLKLSNNLLTGSIPLSIGNLEMLEALDLSSNMLSGPIPPELGNLTFLSYLDLSYNQLTGKIPSRAQFLTFERTSFMFQGNEGLCGFQVSKICSGAEEGQTSAPNSEEPGSVTGSDINWDYTSVAVGYGAGYVAGLGMFVLPLIFCKRWRKWY